MNSSARLKSPIFFVSFSFAVAVLDFLASFVRLMYSYMVRPIYPFEVYLKPFLFLAQAASLILFIRSVRHVQTPTVSEPKLSRFLDAHTVLIVVVILLYLDFKITALAGISTTNAFLELAFYLAYLIALSGTCFWFAFELYRKGRWKWLSIVFILIGLAFLTTFLEPMFFWTQNYTNLVFPSLLVFVADYAPQILMSLAALSTLVILFRQTSLKSRPLSTKLTLFMLVPAFFIPLIWDSYKDGIMNSIIRDVIYYGLGYPSRDWYSVSLYLMSLLAYILTWRELSRRSDHTLAFSLIVLGVASFPWNGIFPLIVGYSSIPGNVISLSAIIIGASLLTSQRGEK